MNSSTNFPEWTDKEGKEVTFRRNDTLCALKRHELTNYSTIMSNSYIINIFQLHVHRIHEIILLPDRFPLYS